MTPEELRNAVTILDYNTLVHMREIAEMDPDERAQNGIHNWNTWSRQQLSKWKARREKIISDWEEGNL